MTKVCLVLGAGAGIGGNVGKKFAREGYHAALCRRSDEEGLNKIVAEIEAEGGSASGHLVNAVKEGAIEDLIETVEADIGPIDVVLYNLGSQIGGRSLEDTTLKVFELGWQMATMGLFRVAKTLFPRMVERGGGTLLVTSATASVRGNAGQHSHAGSMGGRRMLCQTLNAEFASKGIHVAHILIDGAVDAPDTLGKMMGADAFRKLRETRGLDHDGLMLPEKMAETYFHVSQQHRSAWTHELDLRVVMLEEGMLKSSDRFNMAEGEAIIDLYRDAGLQSTKGEGIYVFQGQNVGGGTTINWCASFRTPTKTLRHWEENFGLKGCGEDDLAPFFEVAEKQLNIMKWPSPPNKNNEILKRGAEKLGFSWGVIPRNVDGCWDLGYCGQGCPVDAKKSMLVTTIPSALQRGGKLVYRVAVNALVREGDRVTGVEGFAYSQDGRQKGNRQCKTCGACRGGHSYTWHIAALKCARSIQTYWEAHVLAPGHQLLCSV